MCHSLNKHTYKYVLTQQCSIVLCTNTFIKLLAMSLKVTSRRPCRCRHQEIKVVARVGIHGCRRMATLTWTGCVVFGAQGAPFGITCEPLVAVRKGRQRLGEVSVTGQSRSTTQGHFRENQISALILRSGVCDGKPHVASRKASSRRKGKPAAPACRAILNQSGNHLYYSGSLFVCFPSYKHVNVSQCVLGNHQYVYAIR